MKKMQAICTANNAVDKPFGRTGHWRVFGPVLATDLEGDWTSQVRPTYAEALSARKEWVARIALALMGYEREAIQEALNRCAMGCRLEVIVSDAVKLLEASSAE